MKSKLVGSTLVTADADTNLCMGKDGSKAKLHTNIYFNTTPPPSKFRPNKGQKFENETNGGLRGFLEQFSSGSKDNQRLTTRKRI